MKKFLFKNKSKQSILKTARQFQQIGNLAVSVNNLIYLDITDEYIHQLYPLLDNKNITKPNYFGTGSVGAHISVIYPEEKNVFLSEELGKQHHFSIKDMLAVKIELKTYYAISVESNTLLQLRRKYNLPDLLNFKGHSIDFHITIGVSYE